MKPKDVLAFAKENGAKMLDLRFMDFPGLWQHFSVPIGQLDEGQLRGRIRIRRLQHPRLAADQRQRHAGDSGSGHGQDGSLHPGSHAVHDLRHRRPDHAYGLLPRSAQHRQEGRGLSQKSPASATRLTMGPEAEFFIFDDIRYESDQQRRFLSHRLGRGHLEHRPRRGAEPRLQAAATRKAISRCRPWTVPRICAREMVLDPARSSASTIEAQHHEVATAGQGEIDMKFRPLVQMADQLMWFKYVLKNVAYRNNHTVTFMPKPLFGDNGSGMHTHVSIWKGGKPLFAGDKYAGVSRDGPVCHRRHFEARPGALRDHQPDHQLLQASGARLRGAGQPGLLEPQPQRGHPNSHVLDFAQGQAHRVPHPGPVLQRLPGLLRHPDGGHRRHPEQIDPGEPLDKDIYDLPPEELAKVPSAPGSLEEALNCLKEDHEFLTKGDVFTQDVFDMWIEYKIKSEVDAVRLRPHPHEFFLYFDI